MKKKGSTLLVAIFLSGLILTIGITASKLLVKEVLISAEAVETERAYFAAESGIEKSLLLLNREPTQWVENESFSVGTTSQTTLSIQNQTENFSFDLPSLGNQKFRLTRDQDATFGKNLTFIDNISLNVTPIQGVSVKYLWKILCAHKTTGQTLFIQAISDTTDRSEIRNLLAQNGTDTSGMQTNFNAIKNTVSPESCFLSVQNLLPNATLRFSFSGNPITPHKAKIISIGKSGNQEKHLVFDYAQKNIGSLFDFTFFHIENEDLSHE